MQRSKLSGLLLLVGMSLLSVPVEAQNPVELIRIFRPSVLKQLNGDVLRLVNALPNVDAQNKAIVGRLFAHGGLGYASVGKDGIHRQGIRIPEGQFIWRPAIIVMKHAGELELEFKNEDGLSHHQALLPSNGGRVFIHLPSHTRGTARIRLDAPGLYWFGCPVSNHAGRGMLGLVMVLGEVPEEARLDRPKLEGMRKRDSYKGPEEQKPDNGDLAPRTANARKEVQRKEEPAKKGGEK